MSVNAREEEYEHIEIFGKPALFTNSRIDRATVPKGFWCYDLRGSDYDPGRPSTVENYVAVNHAATVLTPQPIKIPKSGFRRLGDTLNFLGEDLGLSEFCEEYGLDLPPDNRKFTLRPALPEEAGIFFALPKEKDAELGAVGHVRIDFGSEGKEFWNTWWARGKEELNSSEFKAELDELVNELRESGPLKDLGAMYRYCAEHDGQIEGGWRQNYGYVIETDCFRYCLRCSPGQGDYHAYLAAFDLRVQEMNMKHESSAQEFGLSAAGKQKLQAAADNTRAHSYGWFVYQNFNVPGEKFTGGITLPEAICLYKEMDSANKRLGVTKDEIATVDFIITLDGEQWFSQDYKSLSSFSTDHVIAKAVETLKNEIGEQTPNQDMTMGGQTL